MTTLLHDLQVQACWSLLAACVQLHTQNIIHAMLAAHVNYDSYTSLPCTTSGLHLPFRLSMTSGSDAGASTAALARLENAAGCRLVLAVCKTIHSYRGYAAASKADFV